MDVHCHHFSQQLCSTILESLTRAIPNERYTWKVKQFVKSVTPIAPSSLSQGLNISQNMHC